MFPLHKWPKKHAQNLPLNIENAWKMRVIVVVLLLTTVLATRRTHTHHGNNQRNFRNAFWKNNKMEVYLKVTQWGGTTNSSTIIEILSKSPNYLFELYKQSQNICWYFHKLTRIILSVQPLVLRVFPTPPDINIRPVWYLDLYACLLRATEFVTIGARYAKRLVWYLI